MRYVGIAERDSWITERARATMVDVATVMNIEHELMVGVGIIDDPEHVFVYFTREELMQRERGVIECPDITEKAEIATGLDYDAINLLLHLELHYVDPESIEEDIWPECPECEGR